MRWEYKTVEYEAPGLFSTKMSTGQPERQLNHLGGEGWELVATLHPTTTSTINLFIFKRAIVDSRNGGRTPFASQALGGA